MDTTQHTVKVTRALLAEAREYNRLCTEARNMGIPVSLDDPRSPNTVKALAQAVSA